MSAQIRTTFLTTPAGNPAANQMSLQDSHGNTFFQSYNTIIAKVTKKGKVFLDSYYWNYSKTTSKYLSRFLGVGTKEIRARLESGEYRFKNLN